MELFEKITVLQNELKAPKGQYNKFGNYNYRSAEDILEAVKPLLLKHKLTQIITDVIECIGNRVYVKATVIVSDIENGKSISVSAYAREPENKKGMDESQVTGASSSYARKYALNGMWAIDDTKDADSNEQALQTRSRQEKVVLATKEQINKLLSAFNVLGMTNEDVKKWMKVNLNTDTLQSLTIDNYTKLMQWAENLAKKQVMQK